MCLDSWPVDGTTTLVDDLGRDERRLKAIEEFAVRDVLKAWF